MRFSVASHYHRPVEYWLNNNGYTTMVSPPKWAKEHNRNLDIFVPNKEIVFGNVSWEHYKEVYRSILKNNMNAIKQWVAGHKNDHMILLCGCQERENCHRSLIAMVLTWLGCEEVALPGEKTTDLPNDIVVTVPKSFGLDTWINEGDPVGVEWSGQEWDFCLYGCPKPNISPGMRVYVTYNNILRGYAPLVRVDWMPEKGCWSLVRHGDAVAVTIDEPVQGFRGWKHRWWNREDEKDFSYEWYDGRPAWTVPMEIETRAEPSLGKGVHVIYMDYVFPIGAFLKKKEVLTCWDCLQEEIEVTFTTKNAMITHAQQHSEWRLRQKGNEIKERRAEVRRKMEEDREKRLAIAKSKRCAVAWGDFSGVPEDIG
jgi:hypothetical protein